MSQSELSPEPNPTPIREHWAILWVRKWSIVAMAVLTAGAAAAFSALQTPTFDSSAEVLVTPVALSSSDVATPPNIETERKIAESPSVAQLVVQRLDLSTSSQGLLGSLSVEVATNTEILEITYTDPNPETARLRADAFARAYIDFRRQQAQNRLLAVSEGIQTQINRLNNQLTSLNERISEEPSPAERATLQTTATSISSRIAILQQELSEIATPRSLTGGEIVAPASLPQSPASPNYPLNIALALIVGLALGVALAFLRERLDDRLKGRGDLEVHAGAPVLAVVPKVADWKQPATPLLVTIAEPKSGPSEAYRTLRTSLLFSAAQRGAKTVMVTSPHQGEGKTSTAANLGVVLAQAGKRVIVVSADLRKPRLHRFLGVSNENGVTRFLSGEISPQEALQRTPVIENLLVAPSGPIPGNPAELLGSEAMGQFLGQLREVSDFVLIDAPPVLALADALALVPLTDALLLVADSERTSRSSIQHAREQLDQVDARVIGAVLNNFDPAKARPYGYYYRSYYAYQYRYEQAPAEPFPEAGNGGRFMGRRVGR
jgi:succinoglycan biosynthesis transport protein ExoP